MNLVEQLLRTEIGLDSASIGPTMIERAARLRMKSIGLTKPEDYQRLLESSPAEREELVEAIVVTETWFFRERDSFTAFLQLAQEWFQQNPAGPLRILSIPCASGEEPYTMAICLLDARVPPERFVIDAVDISARALARATRAVFGKNSFRGENLDFRSRHFQQTKDGFALNTSVRECVRFQPDNLLNENFLAGREPYHFIFCRNLLIYFDRSTQAKALETLRRKLAPGGLLFAGPAELSIFLDNGFVSANLPMAFICRKAGDTAFTLRTAVRARSVKASRPSTSRAPLAPQPAVQTIAKPPAGNGQPQPATSPTAVTADLDAARKLADAGKLKEAADICETHLRQQGPSAQACYLLGLVLDAGGDARAADYYRKALYLEPNHYETLWHMALLLKKNGDDTEARAFKRRAERAKPDNAKFKIKN